MFDRVEEIIAVKVRPYLQEHNGDIQLIKVEDGIVEVRLLGACSGCPAAKFTLEEIVESQLKENLPEVKKVVIADNISEDMLAFAKQFLGRGKRDADRC